MNQILALCTVPQVRLKSVFQPKNDVTLPIPFICQSNPTGPISLSSCTSVIVTIDSCVVRSVSSCFSTSDGKDWRGEFSTSGTGGGGGGGGGVGVGGGGGGGGGVGGVLVRTKQCDFPCPISDLKSFSQKVKN